MATVAIPDTILDRARRDLRRRARLRRQVGALQPRARPVALPSAPLGGVHTGRRRPPNVRRTDLRGGQARQPGAHPGRPARRGHRPHRRSRAAPARDHDRREADESDPRARPRGSNRDGAARDQHAEALGGAQAARLHLSGRPRLVPVLPRRRAHRHERLVAHRRPLRAHPGPRDQLRDRAPDRRDHPRWRRRREEGAQVVERLPAQAPLHGAPGDARDRHGGDARAGEAPRGGVFGLLRLPVLRGRVEGDR